jgi:hypothetical protein
MAFSRDEREACSDPKNHGQHGINISNIKGLRSCIYAMLHVAIRDLPAGDDVT